MSCIKFDWEIYTDGSKDIHNKLTGAGIVIKNKNNKTILNKGIKLHPRVSIFSRELTAIHIALGWLVYLSKSTQIPPPPKKKSIYNLTH